MGAEGVDSGSVFPENSGAGVFLYFTSLFTHVCTGP